MFFLRFMFFLVCYAFSSGYASPDLQPYTTYLNGIQTLAATFQESNSRGQIFAGKIYLKRPAPHEAHTLGSLRLIYDYPPRAEEIFTQHESTGEVFLIIYDYQQKTYETVPVESTPVVFLLRQKISFAQDVTLKDFKQTPHNTSITFYHTDNPEFGCLTLAFHNHPLQFYRWIITDAQGLKTEVLLKDIQINIPLPDRIFAKKYK